MDNQASTGSWFLWGKLSRGSAAPASFHPLLCHLVDVAVVAAALWRDALSPRARTWFARALALDEEAAGRWIAFLAGLHDLGKASPGFQLQDAAHPLIKDQLAGVGLRRQALLPNPPAHGLVTAAALPRCPCMGSVLPNVHHHWGGDRHGPHSRRPPLGQVQR